MIPINEILLFDSTKRIPEISNMIDASNYVDVTLPIQGLQVDERIFIEDSKRDQITAKVTDIGHFCSGNESIPVILRTPQVTGIVVGRLMQLLPRENKINLTDFRKLKSSWKKRVVDRVQPKTPNYFDIILEGSSYRVNLNEIAPNGMSIFVAVSRQNELDYVIHEKIVLPIKVHPYFDRCWVNGIVKNVRIITNNLVRLGLQIFPDRKANMKLKIYVKLRKEEILREIQNNFRKLQTIPETKDLYF